MKCNPSTLLCPMIFYHLQGPAGLVEFKVGLKVADDAQTKFLKLKKEFATYLKLVPTLSYFLLRVFYHFFSLRVLFDLISVAQPLSFIIDFLIISFYIISFFRFYFIYQLWRQIFCILLCCIFLSFFSLCFSFSSKLFSLLKSIILLLFLLIYSFFRFFFCSLIGRCKQLKTKY